MIKFKIVIFEIKFWFLFIVYFVLMYEEILLVVKEFLKYEMSVCFFDYLKLCFMGVCLLNFEDISVNLLKEVK